MVYVDLAEYKTILQITDTNSDDRLSWFLRMASAYFDARTKNYIDKRSHSENIDGDDSDELVGLYWPIISVSVLTLDGVDIKADTVTYANEGKIYYEDKFTAGKQNIHIEYSSGFVNSDLETVVPDDVVLAVTQIATVLKDRAGKELVSSRNTAEGDVFTWMDKEMPETVMQIIQMYSRSDRPKQSNTSKIIMVV